MRHLIFLLIAIFTTACHHRETAYEKRLQDTLEYLRKKSDFKPLSPSDAYAFINQYYLPKLGSTQIGRKILAYPLATTNFRLVFKTDSALTVAALSGDSVYLKKHKYDIYPPVNILRDEKFKWDAAKLKNCVVVTDDLELTKGGYDSDIKNIMYSAKKPDTVAVKAALKKQKIGQQAYLKEFHKQFGAGYIMVSYPQYNAHTNKLIISEWIENAGTCGTGRDNRYVFKKVADGWQEI